MINEHLTTARDCAKFAARDLRAALAQCGPVEALVILPMIADAHRLAQAIAGLLSARNSTE